MTRTTFAKLYNVEPSRVSSPDFRTGSRSRYGPKRDMATLPLLVGERTAVVSPYLLINCFSRYTTIIVLCNFK